MRIERNKQLAKLRRQASKWNFTQSYDPEVLEIIEERGKLVEFETKAVAFYRQNEFPYLPTDLQWRKSQLQLLNESTNAPWIDAYDGVLQENHSCAPGNDLCLSYNPHIFSVQKIRGHGKQRDSALQTFKRTPNRRGGLAKVVNRVLEVVMGKVPTFKAYKEFNRDTVRHQCCFQNGSWILNFQPTVAATIYERFGGTNGVVYDPCAGWGGRMLGARKASVKKYIACEPSSKTYRGLCQMRDELFADNFDVSLHCCGSEEFKLPSESVDLVFTSPPYFNLELYASEQSQSHVKFPDRDSWCEGFLKTTFENAYRALKPGKFMLINIAKNNLNPWLEYMTKRTALEVGFSPGSREFIRLLKPTGTHTGDPEKFEPIFVFQKSRRRNQSLMSLRQL